MGPNCAPIPVVLYGLSLCMAVHTMRTVQGSGTDQGQGHKVRTMVHLMAMVGLNRHRHSARNTI